VIPQPETVLTGSDEIIALTAPESEDQLRQVVMGASF
jgi:Trk K+ transport system NAD-binding subunit